LAPPRAPPVPAGTDAAAEAKSRRPLRPLLALAPYLRRHRWVIAGALTALVVSALSMLAVPLAVRRMIDVGFGSHDGVLISRYFMMLIVIGFVLACASGARFYFVNWLGERVVADLRTDVFAHLARLGPAFFEKTHSGELMSRLTADTTQIKAAAGTVLSQALRNVIMLIGALVMMFVTSTHLSLMVLLAIPVIVLPLVAYGRVVRTLSRRAQDSLAEASAYAAENLAAVRTMQAFSFERGASRRFGDAVESSFETARERLKARAGLTSLAIFLSVASIVGILWYAAASVVNGEMSGGRLGQFVLYALFAAGALAELSEVWGETNQAAGAAERLTELLALVPEIRSPAAPVPMPEPGRGEIAFEDVRFGYAGNAAEGEAAPAALDGVSFTAEPGSTLALVGPSGAGKTTIFNLILRFFDPQSGRVSVDGVDVRTADLDALRSRIAIVPQEVALFSGSVADNIRYGNGEASDEDVRRAAVAAQADGFIGDLPLGYATVLGERGVSLSGGQRQRIAIARAILRNAPILLLDEATSALDAENEALVQRGLHELMRSRTTLVIAHRLATVLEADRILVFDRGQIVQTGTHTELMAKSGLYRRLAELQFGREAAE
jgi:ATP-binding cassette subfamily B protein